MLITISIGLFLIFYIVRYKRRNVMDYYYMMVLAKTYSTIIISYINSHIDDERIVTINNIYLFCKNTTSIDAVDLLSIYDSIIEKNPNKTTSYFIKVFTGVSNLCKTNIITGECQILKDFLEDFNNRLYENSDAHMPDVTDHLKSLLDQLDNFEEVEGN